MELPTLRWGVIGSGLASSWFVGDLLLSRDDQKARHTVQAIGASSKQKAEEFIPKFAPTSTASPYGSYAEVYQDSEVDIVYIGLPHSFHKDACIAAISHGKHVLCEKSFTLNAHEAREVFELARAKRVFVMEALWTRFLPIVREIRKAVHQDKAIGNVQRVFCDVGLDLDLENLPDSSRLKDPALGAGSLLELGIYGITWGLLLLGDAVGDKAAKPDVFSAQTISQGIDVATSLILHYPETGRQGVLTSTTQAKTDNTFARIEGSDGVILIEGIALAPGEFTVIPEDAKLKLKEYEFSHVGHGFYFEADAVAHDIRDGKMESDTMPWNETLRVFELTDGCNTLARRSTLPILTRGQMMITTDGHSVVTKQPNQHGLVNTHTVRSQLIGCKGLPPPPTLKVAIQAVAGYQAEMLVYAMGLDVEEKAQVLEAQLREDMLIRGDHEPQLRKLEIQLFGTAKKDPTSSDAATAVVRIFAQAADAEALTIFNLQRRVIRSEVRMEVNWEGSDTVEPISDDNVIISDLDDVQQESYEPTDPVDLSRFGQTIRVPLGHKIFARSGDKGSNANIGFFPQDDTQEAWDWLRSFLSTKQMLELLGEEAQTVRRVERVEFANLRCVHFVLFDYIGGSVVDTSRADSLAKGLAEFIRARMVDLPERLYIEPTI
ncbi:hypothetical protein QQX98_000050 [Neonectria punicea]|uniref:D-xylose 1-dehydrogenase (NADP(+), D-xylono-1,5-lactone-forming) n=1 Tax=Neonectria punicea TaxID=979145 RepID=A0ABR1HVS1_9HYPO